MQFRNVYWDRSRMEADHRQPSIIAIGDSWFWYPFPSGSLLNHLAPMVEPRGHVIFAQGSNGAEAYAYAFGNHSRQIRTTLKLYGDSLSAVFISGGGNDFAGLNDLRPMLLDDCSRCDTALACFRVDTEKDSLGWLVGKMEQAYTALVDQIIGATWATAQVGANGRPASATGPTKIVLHNYDYAPVTGIGPFGGESPWLKICLDAARVQPQLHDDCIRLLLDRFTVMLKGLETRYQGRVRVVDSRGALDRHDWVNEMHPTHAGFHKIALRWQPVLQSLGLAP